MTCHTKLFSDKFYYKSTNLRFIAPTLLKSKAFKVGEGLKSHPPPPTGLNRVKIYITMRIPVFRSLLLLGCVVELRCVAMIVKVENEFAKDFLTTDIATMAKEFVPE